MRHRSKVKSKHRGKKNKGLWIILKKKISTSSLDRKKKRKKSISIRNHTWKNNLGSSNLRGQKKMQRKFLCRGSFYSKKGNVTQNHVWQRGAQLSCGSLPPHSIPHGPPSPSHPGYRSVTAGGDCSAVLPPVSWGNREKSRGFLSSFVPI